MTIQSFDAESDSGNFDEATEICERRSELQRA
jgi:hypothetical protein